MVNFNLLRVIKYEPDNGGYLVHKYFKEDFDNKSHLIVYDSQEALFFKDGRLLNLFSPVKHELKTQKTSLFRNIVNIITKGESPFHYELYFINKALNIFKWGTSSKLDVIDSEFKIPLSIGVSGDFEIRVNNSKLLICDVLTTQESFNREKIVNYFRGIISVYVKSYMAKFLNKNSYLAINQKLDDINIDLKNLLKKDFNKRGIKLESFYLYNIFIHPKQTKKINKVMEEKMKQDKLGYDWQEEQKMEIAKKFAENSGNGYSGFNSNSIHRNNYGSENLLNNNQCVQCRSKLDTEKTGKLRKGE